jgi:RNA polymerase sigma factor (sigma-70 family)
MIESNLQLVGAIARPYATRGVSFSDLVQEGAIGLMHAVDRYDHTRDVKFSTYAVWWIRRSILDAIIAERMIRIPAEARRQIAAVIAVEDRLTRSGAHVSEAAIADQTGLSVRSVHALRASGRVTASLDELVGNTSDTLRDLIADPHALDAGGDVEERDQRADQYTEILAMLRLLPERHRQVVMRRYGLGPHRPQTYHEVGQWLGVGQKRARQIEREALRRLHEVAPHHLCAA